MYALSGGPDGAVQVLRPFLRIVKSSLWAIAFQVFSIIQGKTMAKPFKADLLWRLYNSYNHAHAPGPHIRLSPGPCPDSKCFKTAEV